MKTVSKYTLSTQVQTTITINYVKDVISQASKNTCTVDLALKPQTHTLMTSKQSSKRRGGLSGVFAF